MYNCTLFVFFNFQAALFFLGYAICYLNFSLILPLLTICTLVWFETQDKNKMRKISSKSKVSSFRKKDLLKVVDELPSWVSIFLRRFRQNIAKNNTFYFVSRTLFIHPTTKIIVTCVLVIQFYIFFYLYLLFYESKYLLEIQLFKGESYIKIPCIKLIEIAIFYNHHFCRRNNILINTGL